jgi:hypothetical protein
VQIVPPPGGKVDRQLTTLAGPQHPRSRVIEKDLFPGPE